MKEPAYIRNFLYLVTLIIVAGTGAFAGSWGEFSERFPLLPGQSQPLDRQVGRIHFDSVRAEVSKRSDIFTVLVRLEATNPPGHDQQVAMRLKLWDADGRFLGSIEKKRIVEEKESKVLEIRVRTYYEPAAFDLIFKTRDE